MILLSLPSSQLEVSFFKICIMYCRIQFIVPDLLPWRRPWPAESDPLVCRAPCTLWLPPQSEELQPQLLQKKCVKSYYWFTGTSFSTSILWRVSLNASSGLTWRADMFEGSGSSHAESALKLPDQLPGVQSITQVDEARGTVDDWEGAATEIEARIKISDI